MAGHTDIELSIINDFIMKCDHTPSLVELTHFIQTTVGIKWNIHDETTKEYLVGIIYNIKQDKLNKQTNG
jgi:hypothetical protein